MTYAQAAIEVMAEWDVHFVWLGNPDLWGDIYERKHGNNDNSSPPQRYFYVANALRQSKYFYISGHIKSCGFSDRETHHPVFALRESVLSTVSPFTLSGTPKVPKGTQQHYTNACSSLNERFRR